MDLNDLVKNPEQIKSLISVLQTLLNSQEDNQGNHSVEDKPVSTKRNKKTTNTKKQKSQGRENKFLNMPERNMHLEDVEIDKKLHKLPPTPRTRRFKSVKATCRVCGRTETINPSYITTEIDRYKCNKCSGAAG